MRVVSVEDTAAVAGVLAEHARAADVIVLAGDLGAGKTTFTQAFGRARGVTEPITSPTFSLLHRYEASPPIYHADVYRLDSTGELDELGLGELDDGVLLVEWGDVVAGALGEHLAVRLEHVNGHDQQRLITVEAAGIHADRSAELIQAMRANPEIRQMIVDPAP